MCQDGYRSAIAARILADQMWSIPGRNNEEGMAASGSLSVPHRERRSGEDGRPRDASSRPFGVLVILPLSITNFSARGQLMKGISSLAHVALKVKDIDKSLD